MPDEPLREIQLNGKQLVFTFMAATVVAVVIFLCGVMVGRDLQSPSRAASEQVLASDGGGDPTRERGADADLPTAPPAATTDGLPVTAQETLTYAERLETPTPPEETLSVAASADEVDVDRPRPAPAGPPSAAPETSAPRSVPADPALVEPAGQGWAVQVMAVPAVQRTEAEALARRLAAKGYPSYITPRGSRFAVRVGKYKDKREAEAVSARLRKEEQFAPWVTR